MGHPMYVSVCIYIYICIYLFTHVRYTRLSVSMLLGYSCVTTRCARFLARVLHVLFRVSCVRRASGRFWATRLWGCTLFKGSGPKPEP